LHCSSALEAAEPAKTPHSFGSAGFFVENGCMSNIPLEHAVSELESYKSYMASKYLSIKHSSYFHVYDEVFSKYRGRPITFVEIGVLNGGSLFMWRDYFGPQARIIGIDFNPAAKKWAGEGFEIHIGNQADPNFWSEFFQSVGMVDVVLDDGGHTNEQQIVTTLATIPHIRDGGVLMVEDVHASYMRQFSNPSRYSFVNFSKFIVDVLNTRFPKIRGSKHVLRNMVYSISFFESIISFRVDRRLCYVSVPTSNNGVSENAKDFYQHLASSRGLRAQLRNLSLGRFFQK
jgi:hypothetical protein